MLELGMREELTHFTVHPGRMDDVADAVLGTINKNYASLDIPFHARWRHFVVDGADRWEKIASAASWPDRAARGRAEFDLVIVSVLLDAGAGAAWHYKDAVSGRAIGRSEGLALASLDM